MNPKSVKKTMLEAMYKRVQFRGALGTKIKLYIIFTPTWLQKGPKMDTKTDETSIRKQYGLLEGLPDRFRTPFSIDLMQMLKIRLQN